MSSFSDSEFINQLFVAKDEVKPECLGRGEKKINGSCYMQGPTQIGKDSSFSSVEATVMIGPDTNSESKNPDRSLFVKGDVKIEGDGKTSNALLVQGDTSVSGNVSVGGDVTASEVTASGITLTSRKSFDIPHPSKEGYRLRHICLEGPEAGVYIRGRVRNKTEIELPDYWKDLVDIQSITVSLTPIGSHQHVMVKRWDESKIYLQSNGGMPIDCFYHIFAERKDGEKLIVEYQGESPADYPGDASQYSVAGYDYGAKRG